MTTIDYNKQATDFLQATNTTFTAKFKEHAQMWDDNQMRDIFTCTLTSNKGGLNSSQLTKAFHKYTFKFGQSINNSTGAGNNPPTAYDVLSCLTKYDPGTFSNFCSEYGYDIDSRKAYKTYKAVMKEWKNVELLFTPEEREQLREIN